MFESLILKIVIACFLAILSVQAFGQGSEHLAFKKMRKGKWEQAYSQLSKALAKDSLDVGAAYTLAHYFFAPQNPDFSVDSAYCYTQRALLDYPLLTPKQQERLQRGAIDSLTLISFRDLVDSAAFYRACALNTERAFIFYIDNYSFSERITQANALRNEAAYLDALTENTYQAFDDFMVKYPQAARASDARNKYDSLLFQAKTIDKRLNSYERYLKDYPDSPYRRKVEEAIFEIITASGTKESYASYLDSYGDSHFFSRKARNILFHIVAEDLRDGRFAAYLDSDSLMTAFAVEQGYIVPFFENEKFGFMNQDGLEVIQALAGEISAGYALWKPYRRRCTAAAETGCTRWPSDLRRCRRIL